MMKKNSQQLMVLVAGHRSGNAAAQKLLFNLLLNRARSIFYHKNFCQAHSWEDVEQDVVDKILALFDYPFEEKVDGSPIGLVDRSFTNLFIDLSRKKSRSIVVCISNVRRSNENKDKMDLSDLDCTNSIGADDIIHYKELRTIVKRGIARLGDKQRQILELVLLQEKEPKEVMQILTITRQQYDNNKFIGLNNLKNWLRKYLNPLAN